MLVCGPCLNRIKRQQPLLVWPCTDPAGDLASTACLGCKQHAVSQLVHTAIVPYCIMWLCGFADEDAGTSPIAAALDAALDLGSDGELGALTEPGTASPAALDPMAAGAEGSGQAVALVVDAEVRWSANVLLDPSSLMQGMLRCGPSPVVRKVQDEGLAFVAHTVCDEGAIVSWHIDLATFVC